MELVKSRMGLYTESRAESRVHAPSYRSPPTGAWFATIATSAGCGWRRSSARLGDWFYTLAIYSLLLELTGKAQSVGLALVLQVLPPTLVGPTAGVVNDRIRRKHVMIAADLARVVIVLGMMLVRSRAMVWLVYPLLFLETVMWAFFEPARSAVIPNVVGEIVADRQHALVASRGR